jgi:hypothetical protein
LKDSLTREASAIHEAGHGVLATILGLNVPITGLCRDGGCAWVESGPPDKLAIVALAGQLAQARFVGRSSAPGGDCDLKEAKACAQRIFPEHKIAAALTDWAREAEDLLDRYWPAVVEVARVLRGRPMLGQELFDVVRGTDEIPVRRG